MRVVHISYISKQFYTEPNAWLKRLNFFTALLEASTVYGHVSSIHCIGYSGVLVKNNVTYHFLKQRGFQLLFPWSLHNYLKQLSPDVVIVHSLNFPQNILLLRWQLGRRVKILVHHHLEGPPRFPKNYIQQIADNFIQSYLFTADALAEPWIKARLIKDQSKIKEVPEGSSVFSPMEKRIAQKKTNVEGQPIYLWVGRLNKNKDPLTLIRAFAEFNEQHPSASLYMIFHTIELLSELHSFISMHPSLKRSVHLVGKVDHDDMIYWYNSADFFVLASHHEGTAISVSEAMSCGCVPILTDIPSFKMMTKAAHCGLLYPPGNAAELQKALMKSTRMNLPDERNKTLDVFNANLSFAAIAEAIHDSTR